MSTTACTARRARIRASPSGQTGMLQGLPSRACKSHAPIEQPLHATECRTGRDKSAAPSCRRPMFSSDTYSSSPSFPDQDSGVYTYLRACRPRSSHSRVTWARVRHVKLAMHDLYMVRGSELCVVRSARWFDDRRSSNVRLIRPHISSMCSTLLICHVHTDTYVRIRLVVNGICSPSPRRCHPHVLLPF
jgi:hypothetical protein